MRNQELAFLQCAPEWFYSILHLDGNDTLKYCFPLESRTLMSEHFEKNSCFSLNSSELELRSILSRGVHPLESNLLH